jgi:hypothetical protein
LIDNNKRIDRRMSPIHSFGIIYYPISEYFLLSNKGLYKQKWGIGNKSYPPLLLAQFLVGTLPVPTFFAQHPPFSGRIRASNHNIPPTHCEGHLPSPVTTYNEKPSHGILLLDKIRNKKSIYNYTNFV